MPYHRNTTSSAYQRVELHKRGSISTGDSPQICSSSGTRRTNCKDRQKHFTDRCEGSVENRPNASYKLNAEGNPKYVRFRLVMM